MNQTLMTKPPVRVFRCRPRSEPATAMFVDICGSMALSGSIDSVGWWLLVRDAFELMAHAVERYGGRVETFTGDGLLAIFEPGDMLRDDAVRACSAALWLTSQLRGEEWREVLAGGPPIAVRIGVNSGEIVHGTMSGGRDLHRASCGHAIGVARRIEEIATPGEVWAADATARLVEGFLELAERGTHTLKGAVEPVAVFAVRESGR